MLFYLFDSLIEFKFLLISFWSDFDYGVFKFYIGLFIFWQLQFYKSFKLFSFSMSCSFTMSPSKLASRIFTIFGCLHSVKILISVKKHSRQSFLFTIFLTLIILTATCFFVFKSTASLTFAYLPSPMVFIISYLSSKIFLTLIFF